VQSVQSGMSSFIFLDGMVTIAKVKVIAFVLALAVGALLVAFLRRSRMGQAIRATSQNARAARILGIDTDRVYAATFAINSAICGAAGGLVAMTWIIHPYLGLTYTLRSFMIVIVAGLGNVAGVLMAGAGLGIAENAAGFVFGAEYQTAFVFGLLVVILVVRSALLKRTRRYLH
jgi:branched-chain amino acid transport system permease protein